MPLISPDTSEVKSMQPLEPGIYPATIVTNEFKTSKSGNPMLVVTFEITHEGVSRKRNAYLVITGAGAYGFDSLLRAAGFTDYADRLKEGSKEQFDTDQLNGMTINLQMDQQTYNGQMTDTIKGYLPA